MMVDTISESRVLLVRAGSCVLAVGIADVSETFRPLPIEPLQGVPPFVRGVAIIRGLATPVVDLGALLGSGGGAIGRFVTVRAGGRQLALAVESVLGVRALPSHLPRR